MRSFLVYIAVLLWVVAIVLAALYATNPGSSTLVATGTVLPSYTGYPSIYSGFPETTPVVGLAFTADGSTNVSETFHLSYQFGGSNTTVTVESCGHGSNGSLQGTSCNFGVGAVLLNLTGGQNSGSFVGNSKNWYFINATEAIRVSVNIPPSASSLGEEYGAFGLGAGGIVLMFLGLYLRDPLNRPAPRLAQMKRTLYFLFQSKLAVLGLGIIIFFVLVALLSPVLAPYSPAIGACADSSGCNGNGQTLPVFSAFNAWNDSPNFQSPNRFSNDDQCVYPGTPTIDGGPPLSQIPVGDCVPYASGAEIASIDYNVIGPTWTFYPFNPGPVPLGSLPIDTSNLYVDIYTSEIRATPWDLSISVAIVGAGSLIGLLLGTVAGYLGGIADEVIMRLTDIFLSIPGFLLVLVIMISVVSSGALPNTVISRMGLLVGAFVITWWPGYTRVIRGQVLVTREQKYVEAARASGARSGRIIRKHIIPNSIFPMLVQFSLDVGTIPLTLGSIAFLGFGYYIFPTVNPPFPEWGVLSSYEVQLGAANGKNLFASLLVKPVPPFPWWEVVFPGLTLFLFCISVNFFSDGMRDALDPRLRR